MLVERLAVSAPIIAVAAATLLWDGLPGAVLFYLLGLVLIVVAAQEFFRMTSRAGCPGFPRLTASFGVAMLTMAALSSTFGARDPVLLGFQIESLLLLAFLLAAFCLAFRQPGEPAALTRVFVSTGGLIYVCWTLSCIAKLYFGSGQGSGGRFLLLFLVAVTKLGDVGAYAVGNLSARLPGGNHKMAPRLSPKKSWEGLFGGAVFSVVAAAMLVLLLEEKFMFHGVPVLSLGSALVWGCTLAALGVLGDLAESALKRAARVGDSGRLPGLGGVLDMLDSLMLAAPAFYCYVSVYSALR